MRKAVEIMKSKEAESSQTPAAENSLLHPNVAFRILFPGIGF
jgi:hypothetical protein